MKMKSVNLLTCHYRIIFFYFNYFYLFFLLTNESNELLVSEHTSSFPGWIYLCKMISFATLKSHLSRIPGINEKRLIAMRKKKCFFFLILYVELLTYCPLFSILIFFCELRSAKAVLE